MQKKPLLHILNSQRVALESRHRSTLSVCMHTAHTIHVVLYSFKVLCTLLIALHTNILQSILANKKKGKKIYQCKSAEIKTLRIQILAKTRKKRLYSNFI